MFTRPFHFNSIFSLALKITCVFLFLSVGQVLAQSTEDCAACHEDMELEAEDGHLVGVNIQGFHNSIHGDFDCIDCHDQSADWEDVPHFSQYQRVDCAMCHDDAVDSFDHSFHGIALSSSTPNAPNCVSCHAADWDPHQISGLDLRSSENACKQCHLSITDRYDSSVHFSAAQKGKNSPGCITCHPTHYEALPPSAGAINNLCEECHKGAMDQIWTGMHQSVDPEKRAVMSCASCHDVHATHKPHIDTGPLQACNECHPGYEKHFEGSVHEPLLLDGTMNCLSCHRTHQVTDASEQEHFGCGACHSDIEMDYRSSAHRMARLRGDEVAADCADCHSGHHILPASDPESKIHRENIPDACGECHGSETVITQDYVRLPISMPSYSESIHGHAGDGVTEDGEKLGAVCTDCHGTHALHSAGDPTSKINRQNLAATCGECHQKASKDYAGSIHGRALALGIKDAPSCTDCHDEHLILSTDNPKSEVSDVNQASKNCGRCHEDPQMAARYGLPLGAFESYQDSYHGWALSRGVEEYAIATCTDCHNTHDIRSSLDPASSVHIDRVVETCGRCHDNSNAKFAASYSHILAQDKMMIHDWVRLVYIVLISVVLGGMAIHNIIIFAHYMVKHYKRKKSRPAVVRMSKSELIQHLVLFISFTGLAISGFALRFPDAWWVKLHVAAGLTEESRRIFHRVMAAILVGASFYHIYFLLITKRGRILGKAILPRFQDAKDAVMNMAYYMGFRKEKPTYGVYDYTQKAEYWALIWGTVVMAITGFILMYPEIVTGWLPAWVVRVSETIHYYEAILAVSAIIIWHFFFVIFLPKEYPMSWTWVDGEMPKEHWEEHHGNEVIETGVEPEKLRYPESDIEVKKDETNE